PSVASVFFFHGEDGIRDRNVTGVQTCALPIFSAGTRGLNDKTVESAFGINCGDLTLSGDGLAVNRGGGTSALDVRNRDDLIRGSSTRGVAGFASDFGVTRRVSRGRCASGEVSGVVVGVGTVFIARSRGGVIELGSGRGFYLGSCAITNQVNGLRGVVAQFHGTFGTAHIYRRGDISNRKCWQVLVISGSLLDEEVAAGGNGASQRGHATGVAVLGEIFDFPIREIDGFFGW